MQKSIVAVVFILVLIALLPIVGNRFMKTTISQRVAELQSVGLEVSKEKSEFGYLNTSRHFEFILKDTQKFITYLEQYSQKQIPPYVDALVKGVLLGVDLKYSNFPFAKSLTLELYPIFLSTKGIFYHIQYNFLNNDFKGFVKGINEKYKLDNGLKLIALLQKANFNGVI